MEKETPKLLELNKILQYIAYSNFTGSVEDYRGDLVITIPGVGDLLNKHPELVRES